LGKAQAILSGETSSERNASKTGELVVELGSRRKSFAESGSEVRRSVSSRSMSSRVENISEIEQPEWKLGMVLPFEPLSITFEDIRYAVDMPQVLLDYMK
ncbi:unnamed protein product, partial [Ilex paraguariensis]